MNTQKSVAFIACCLFGTGCAYLSQRTRDFSDMFTLSVEERQVGGAVRCFVPLGLCAASGRGYGLREGCIGSYRYKECGYLLVGAGAAAYTWCLEFIPSNDFREKDYRLYVRDYPDGGGPDGDYEIYLEGLNLQANLGLYYGIRAGINLPEVLDFVLGLTTFDLLNDDFATAPVPDPHCVAERERFFGLAHEAGQGDAQAQYDLGLCYANGRGVPMNLVEAAKWLRRAADRGFTPAHYQVGLCFRDGNGVVQNYSEAYAWFSVSATTNETAAQCRDALANRMSPEQISDGERRAAELHARFDGRQPDNIPPGLISMAASGDAESQNRLGDSYAFGQGVKKDQGEAVKWWRRAAAQNSPEAQYCLAVCYAEGQGVAVDLAEAVKWFRKAAELNHAAAQWRLAVSYDLGHGVAEDDVEAYAWSSLIVQAARSAAAKKDAEEYSWSNLAAQTVRSAAAKRDDLGKRMSPQQSAAGEKRIVELQTLIKSKTAGQGR